MNDGQMTVKTYQEGTAATRATAKYQKKKGLVAKSYKLPRQLVEEFAEACEEMEVSQASVLTDRMKRYVKKYHPDYQD